MLSYQRVVRGAEACWVSRVHKDPLAYSDLCSKHSCCYGQRTRHATIAMLPEG